MRTAVTSMLTAPAGTGKSYVVIYDLVTYFLPEESGRFWSNLPLGEVPESHSSPPEYAGERFTDRIGQYVEKHFGKPAGESVERIKTIPKEVLDTWRTGESGPWDYFLDCDMTGAKIVIDEAHNYIGSKHSRAAKQKWQQFCGELRHMGASIQFVTQSPAKLAREVIDEAGVRQALVNAEEERDPFFKITLRYWYQLRAKLVGRYEACFVRIDLRDIDGKKTKRDHIQRIKREPEIFALYDSYAAPQAGGNAASGAINVHPFQEKSWPELLLWFFRANKLHFARPLGFLALIVAVVFFWEPAFIAFQDRMLRAAGVDSVESPGVVESSPILVASADEGNPLEVENRRLYEELRMVQAALAEAEEVLRQRSALSALAPHYVTLTDGRRYAVGDKIYGGPYDGKRIVSVSLAGRYAVLDGGLRVYLGATKPAAAAGGSLSPQPTPALAPVGADGSRQAGNGVSSGAAGSRLVTGDSGWDAIERNRAGGDRNSRGDFGRASSASRRADSRAGSPPRYAADAYGQSIISR